MADLVEQLAAKLQKCFGDRLVSVILYGSAAAGDRDARHSDWNVLCVVRSVGVPELRDMEPVARWWRQQHNPAPLLLGEEELRTATDCFAIEFHDIRECHRVLAGADVVSGLTVDDAFYRAQVERELRAKLLRLRQKAAGVLSHPDLLLRLMADSVSTFCILLRHALRLCGHTAPMRKRDAVDAAARAFQIDAELFHTLLALRDGSRKAQAAQAEHLLARYLRQLDAVVARVDAVAR